MSEHPEPGAQHWLTRPATIRRLWMVFIAILVMVVGVDIFLAHHSAFGIKGFFGFYAWYGFGSCVLMVVGARLLGFVLKRGDTYYGDE